MTFLHPSFFWALGVLAVPIIIHLFNFRKTRRVYFSNNRFLKKVKENTTAKRKLKHYLILASRLLFLFFLVIAFCQPILPAREEQVNHQNVVFYLDNSQSMSAPISDRTRGLDAGIAFISQIVETFPVDSRYRLVTNDFAPYSNTFKTKTEIQELLSQIRLSPVSRTIDEVKQRMLRDPGSGEQEIFWISDFQKSTAGIPNPSNTDSIFSWHLVPITFDNLANVFVDTVYLENPLASSGERNVLRVKVRNDGKQNVDQLNVKLNLNGIQAGATNVRVPAGGLSEAAFDLTTRLDRLNRASVSFNDYPVSFDNEFFFSLNYRDKIRVIEIKNSDAVTPIERVYGNREIFTFRSSPVSNFNYSTLAEADLVVVNSLDHIDDPLQLALREYLNRNGVVFVIPGKNPDEGSLKTFLQLPVFSRVSARATQDLERPEFTNPFFENVFEEQSNSMVMPKALPVIDWGADRSAILRFKNDKPFLSRFSGQGTLFVLASPLEAGYTDFYNHALFVPVMYRMATTSKRNEQRLYYQLRESLLTLRLDSLADDEQIKLVNDEEIIPGQRRIGRQVVLDIPRHTVKAGFYRVVAASDTVDLLAFNPDRSESLMAQLDQQEIASFFGGGNIRFFESDDTESFGDEIRERYLGTPLWKYAILLALLFLAAEVLLIRFMK